MGHCAPVAKLTLKHTKHCGTGTIVKAGLEFIFARERIKIIIAPPVPRTRHSLSSSVGLLQVQGYVDIRI